MPPPPRKKSKPKILAKCGKNLCKFGRNLGKKSSKIRKKRRERNDRTNSGKMTRKERNSQELARFFAHVLLYNLCPVAYLAFRVRGGGGASEGAKGPSPNERSERRFGNHIVGGHPNRRITRFSVKFSIMRFSIISIVDIPYNIL